MSSIHYSSFPFPSSSSSNSNSLDTLAQVSLGFPLKDSSSNYLSISSRSISPSNQPSFISSSSSPTTTTTTSSPPSFSSFSELYLYVEDAPSRWYKDKRGKDNFITLKVKLQNIKNETIKNYNIFLKLTLHYENNTDIPIKQDIFKIMNSHKLRIGENGETDISFRIEQVSRVHQHNKFIIKIEVDHQKTSSQYSQIRHVFTTPIEVLSKIPRKSLSQIDPLRIITTNNNCNDQITGKKRSLSDDDEEDDEVEEEKYLELNTQKLRRIDEISSNNSIFNEQQDELTMKINQFINNEIENFRMTLSKKVPIFIQDLRNNYSISKNQQNLNESSTY